MLDLVVAFVGIIACCGYIYMYMYVCCYFSVAGVLCTCTFYLYMYMYILVLSFFPEPKKSSAPLQKPMNAKQVMCLFMHCKCT